MAIHSLQRGQITRPARKTVQAVRVPAPLKGIDARVALSQESPEHCVYTINIVPYEYGMQSRRGYREYAINLDAGAGDGVRTLIPFDGIEENGAEDKLFAVTNEGIWDVTEPTDTPLLVYTFPDQSTDAGYGVYSHYVGNNGEDILFHADSVNGLHSYTAATNTWVQTGGIVGPDVTNINYVVVHKQRVWMIEENSTSAWYLPVASNSGQATEFYFGPKFRHGGSLRGLFSWSVDGGAGLDDMLVAVSSAGDVAVYQGADPSSADSWEMRGVYYIGDLPAGPNFGSEHGGELYLLSAHGVTSMNDLLQGVDNAANTTFTVADKITGILRPQMALSRTRKGWDVRSIPSEGALLISSPLGQSPLTTNRDVQYFYSFSTGGWGAWRDVPMACYDTWKGFVAFGTADGRVCYMDTYRDDVKFTPPEEGENGVAVEFSILTSYSDLGAPSLFKRIHHIRADFIADTAPNISIKAFYEFDLLEQSQPISQPTLPTGAWDISDWDAAVWGAGGGGTAGKNVIRGAVGVGRYVGIAMTGKIYHATRLMGWDIMFDVGGEML